MNLFLVRHGLSAGNVTGRIQGWSDIDLTAEGARQAEQTGAFLARYTRAQGLPIAAIYSSDLRRAWHTAAALGRHLALPVTAEPGLREMHFGRVAGLTPDEFIGRYPDLAARWADRADRGFGWPGGETRAQFYDRITRTMRRITAAHAPDANLIVVSHGGPISCYLALIEQGDPGHWLQFPVANCSISRIELAPGADHPLGVACILAANEAGHLADDLTAAG
jgi:probable phosphoglycerate mutase